MKRRAFFVLLIAALILAPVPAMAHISFSGMTLEELYAARIQLDKTIAALERQNGQRMYESGGYLVGRDIPAGDYVIFEKDDAVFASVTIRSGEAEDTDLLTYQLINRQAVIRLEPDTWFTLSECRACPISQVDSVLDENGHAGEGGYPMGALLPEGSYSVTPMEKAPLASYSIYGGILGTGAQLLKFEVLHDAVTLDLTDGDYIVLSGCELTLNP